MMRTITYLSYLGLLAGLSGLESSTAHTKGGGGAEGGSRSNKKGGNGELHLDVLFWCKWAKERRKKRENFRVVSCFLENVRVRPRLLLVRTMDVVVDFGTTIMLFIDSIIYVGYCRKLSILGILFRKIDNHLDLFYHLVTVQHTVLVATCVGPALTW